MHMTINLSHNLILPADAQISQLLLNWYYLCRVAPINCDFFRPAERVRLMTGRLIGNYPAGEFHHYWPPTSSIIKQHEIPVIQYKLFTRASGHLLLLAVSYYC